MYLQTILIKPASSQCNMNCDYCFYCDEAAKREYGSYGMMSEETLRNLIKKSLFQAVSDICFAFQGCRIRAGGKGDDAERKAGRCVLS